MLWQCDATEFESLSQKYNVQGFPTLKWFKDGELTDFVDSHLPTPHFGFLSADLGIRPSRVI